MLLIYHNLLIGIEKFSLKVPIQSFLKFFSEVLIFSESHMLTSHSYYDKKFDDVRYWVTESLTFFHEQLVEHLI